MDKLDECLRHFERLRPILYKSALKLVRDWEMTNDLLQEVQIKILENISQLRLESVDAWIFKVTYHEAVNQRKKNSREQTNLEKFGKAMHYETTPELDVECAEFRQLLDGYLRQLSPEVAQFIYLHCINELSYFEIGRKHGMPMSTVRSKVQRGLKNLRKMLQEDGFDRNL